MDLAGINDFALKRREQLDQIIATSQAPEELHKKLTDGRLLYQSPGTVWIQSLTKKTSDEYAWKLHLFAPNYPLWANVSRAVMPWLIRNDILFKTVDDDSGVFHILEDEQDAQFGKAFTIYPRDQQEFEMVARELDIELKKFGMQSMSGTQFSKLKEHHNLSDERTIGDSGYLFYRADQDPNDKYIPDRQLTYYPKDKRYNPFDYPDPFKDIKTDKDYEELRMNTDIEPFVTTENGQQRLNYYFKLPHDRWDKAAEIASKALARMGLKATPRNGIGYGVSAQDLQNYFDRKNNRPQRHKYEDAKQKVEVEIADLHRIADEHKIKNSADNAEPSRYYVPKQGSSVAEISDMMTNLGIKHDIHKSTLYGGSVVRVLARDLPRAPTPDRQQKKSALDTVKIWLRSKLKNL